MKAVLLAAGIGTRLRPITEKVPKCLVPIAGRPLLAYWLDALFGHGIDEVLINLHHHASQVEEFIDKYRPNKNIRSVYEKELLGTAGTLIENRNYFDDSPFMVIHADNVCFADLSEFKNAHQNRPRATEITMMTFITSHPKESGIVEANSEGIVSNLHEKVREPPSLLANGAVYIFEPTVLSFMERQGKLPLDISTEVLPAFLGKIFSWFTDSVHIDIGTPERLRHAEAVVMSLNRSSGP